MGPGRYKPRKYERKEDWKMSTIIYILTIAIVNIAVPAGALPIY